MLRMTTMMTMMMKIAGGRIMTMMTMMITLMMTMMMTTMMTMMITMSGYNVLVEKPMAVTEDDCRWKPEALP